jgi:hypothetical protein
MLPTYEVGQVCLCAFLRFLLLLLLLLLVMVLVELS